MAQGFESLTLCMQRATITDDNGNVLSEFWGSQEDIAFEIAAEIEDIINNDYSELHILISD